jgi:TonB-dependent SusC/RagA subfamily outer membrane receptor
LTEDVHKLNELVVVGYGVMKKKDLTGAVGSLAAKDMENSPVANIGQAIQGKIAGLQVVDAGKPGDNVTIKVRGMGSINNCDPLVVIDGVPTDLGINAINMADVERLDVLKDASATAIYGSRGANGVIMITTKKGKEGKGHLSLSANLAVQNATRTPDLLNASQYAVLSNEMMNNSGNTANPEWADPSALGKGTDWVDELFRTGYMQNYTLSYSGGSDKAHYYVSGGMLDQTGIVRSVKYRRFTFQQNSDAQVQPWLKMTSNITVSADRKQQGSYDMGNTYRALPVFAVKDANGEWTGPEGNSLWYGSARNPIGPTTTIHSMQRYLAIIILFIATATSSMADTNGKLIQRIDSIIDNITQIYGKKQARIDFYKSMAHKSQKPETLLSAYDKLYDEYFVFQFDSAMVYADKAITLADRIGDKFHHDKCRIEKASLLGVGGLYGEAVALLDEIDSTII